LDLVLHKQSAADFVFFLRTDSPGAPPSATAHELFRGFSFIAPIVLHEDAAPKPAVRNTQVISSVSVGFLLMSFEIRFPWSSAQVRTCCATLQKMFPHIFGKIWYALWCRNLVVIKKMLVEL